jgi:hypothetical protein
MDACALNTCVSAITLPYAVAQRDLMHIAVAWEGGN